jgi:hypothetical protein
MGSFNLHLAMLKKARDVAGGVTFLARKVEVSTDYLEAMLHQREEIPRWVFLRLVDYFISSDGGIPSTDELRADFGGDALLPKDVPAAANNAPETP